MEACELDNNNLLKLYGSTSKLVIFKGELCDFFTLVSDC